MKMIIGLGNPGERFANTRHNAGWRAINKLAGEENWYLEKKFNALVKKEAGFIFLKPLSYMNRSGENTYQALKYYQLINRQFGLFTKKDQDLKNVLAVIHDDLDLTLGDFKMSSDSRSGGNKGVQSIINHVKTKNFCRLRLGIKNELLRKIIPAEKFVLQRFTAEEEAILDHTINQAIITFKKSFYL